MGATAGLMLLSGTNTYMQLQQQQRQASALTARGSLEQKRFDQNAALAEQQAQDALDRGTYAAAIRRSQVRGEIGSARAAMAAQGIQLDTGSALDVQEDYARIGALDIATIRNNAAREAWGYRSQATDLRSRGILAKAGSDSEALGLRSEMGTTLLTGVAKTYGIYRDRNR